MLRIKNRQQRHRAAALVEYGLIVAGVSFVTAAAIAVFGHKVSDLIAATATILPGNHADDNGPIISGKLIETSQNAANNNAISLGVNEIANNAGTSRLSNNVGADMSSLVIEAE